MNARVMPPNNNPNTNFVPTSNVQNTPRPRVFNPMEQVKQQQQEEQQLVPPLVKNQITPQPRQTRPPPPLTGGIRPQGQLPPNNMGGAPAGGLGGQPMGNSPGVQRFNSPPTGIMGIQQQQIPPPSRDLMSPPMREEVKHQIPMNGGAGNPPPMTGGQAPPMMQTMGAGPRPRMQGPQGFRPPLNTGVTGGPQQFNNMPPPSNSVPGMMRPPPPRQNQQVNDPMMTAGSGSSAEAAIAQEVIRNLQQITQQYSQVETNVKIRAETEQKMNLLRDRLQENSVASHTVCQVKTITDCKQIHHCPNFLLQLSWKMTSVKHSVVTKT